VFLGVAGQQQVEDFVKVIVGDLVQHLHEQLELFGESLTALVHLGALFGYELLQFPEVA